MEDKAMNDDLLIKYLLEEADMQEREQVRAWIDAHPDNRKEYERFRTIWLESKQLTPKITTDTNLAWERFRERVSQPAEVISMSSQKRKFFSPAWLRVAAVLFIVAGAWSFYEFYLSAFSSINAGQIVHTERLPDGSEVVLNKHTKLSYQRGFRGDERRVRLENGEVFFRVSRDPKKPFIIETGEATVRVLGTSFNIKHHGGQTEVIVETGLVNVSRTNESVNLNPGEKVIIKQGQTRLQKEMNTDLLYQYYRNKTLVANNTPLWRVVDALNEVYGNRVRIENPALRDLRLNATFKEDSLNDIVHVIAETFKIHVTQESDQFIFR